MINQIPAYKAQIQDSQYSSDTDTTESESENDHFPDPEAPQTQDNPGCLGPKLTLKPKIKIKYKVNKNDF